MHLPLPFQFTIYIWLQIVRYTISLFLQILDNPFLFNLQSILGFKEIGILSVFANLGQVWSVDPCMSHVKPKSIDVIKLL